jgi:hypothetical protein
MEHLATIYIPEAGNLPAPPPGGGQPSLGEAWTRFHQDAGPAIRGGEALMPTVTAVTVRHGAGSGYGDDAEAPLVTDGPFAEATEVVGGYYVFDTAARADAEALAAGIPALAAPGAAVEVQPLVMSWAPEVPPAARPGDARYLALGYRPADGAFDPGSEAFQEAGRRHEQFRLKHADALLAGAAVDAGAAVTTVRRPDGVATTTDGPAAAADHVIAGFYLLQAPSPDAARALALDIPSLPGGAVELRPVVQFADRDDWA